MPEILEGKKVAEGVYSKVLLELSLLPVVPKLVVVLVGEDPASQTYVRSKTKKCMDLGIRSDTLKLPPDIAEAALIEKIEALNRDKDVHGILVQLPLPKHISKQKVLQLIDPRKDVDGLHRENVGWLGLGEPRLVPCTPLGVIEMLKFYQIPMEGQRAVVIGRSDIVGKPMAQLLLLQNATVTLCHSKTANLKEETRRADIVIAALGAPKAINGDYIKDGAVVIDVGIHRTENGLCGDVDFESVAPKAKAISPVPGGVGPMTIAMLMHNVALAARLAHKA